MPFSEIFEKAVYPRIMYYSRLKNRVRIPEKLSISIAEYLRERAVTPIHPSLIAAALEVWADRILWHDVRKQHLSAAVREILEQCCKVRDRSNFISVLIDEMELRGEEL